MVEKRTLYIVATPIGHLGDMTLRAIEVLREVDCIVVEDTRHSQQLLTHLGIRKPLISLHEHNEAKKAAKLLDRILSGESMALISDAGTPLISDPGYLLVHLAIEKGVEVVPIPGPCALIAALSVSGLPSDRFIFEGFLPAKTNARRRHLETLKEESRTLIFYEAPHRILDTLEDLMLIFGQDREAVIARELTKNFETIRRGRLEYLLKDSRSDLNQQRGEIVILVNGKEKDLTQTLTPEVEHLLQVLLSELSVKQASSIAHKITGVSKRKLYEYAIKT